jgi:putative transposase
MDQDTLRFLLREAVRETVTEVLQTVLELDRTAFLQAHGGRRNGYYPRRLETTFGQVDLKVPRDREGRSITRLFSSPTPAAWWTWGKWP